MEIGVEYSGNTRIANIIRERDNICGKRKKINIGGLRKELEVIFAITEPLSCFECDVADAVYTLYKNGYTHFTLGQVLRTMSGDNKQTITAQKKKDIKSSIDKLRQTKIRIECEKEFKARKTKFDGANAYSIEGYFLSATWNEKEKCYEMPEDLPLEQLMPLYRYTELNTQMISFPVKLLSCENADEKISNTNENIMIKRYLIRRIEIMRAKDERENRRRKTTKENKSTIKRDRRIIYVRKSHRRKIQEEKREVGLLPTLGIYEADTKSDAYWKRKIKNVHETVKKILDYYCSVGYIERYEEVRGDYNRILGVQIIGEIENPWECF